MAMLDWLLNPFTQGGKNVFTQITTPPPSSPLAARVSPTPATSAPTVLAGQSQVSTPTTPTTAEAGGVLQKEGVSLRFFRAAQSAAETIRRGIPIVSQKLQAVPIVGKPLATVTPYTSESVARLIETGSMIPGGVEVIGREVKRVATTPGEIKPSGLFPAIAAGISQIPSSTIKSATEEPAQFVSDIATSTILSAGAAKVMPMPKYAEVKVPTTAGTAIKPVYETVYKGVTFAERPVIGYTPKVGITIGRPSAIGIEPTKILSGYFPQTALETRVVASPAVMKSLGIASTEIEKLAVGRGLIDITKTQKSAFMRELPSETKTLPKEGVQVVKDVLRENKAQVEKIAGSYAAQAQMMPEHVRVPGDIDLYLKTNQPKAIKIAQSMLEKLKAKGIDAQIDPENPTRIVTRGEQKEWVHAVELHYAGETPTLETAMVGSSSLGDIRYGYAVEQKPIMIEGFKSMRLSEQGIRKVTGSLEWRPSTEGEAAPGLKLSPAGHRLKDITDAYFVQKTLIESKKASPIRRVVEAGKIRRGEVLLERWKSLFPEVEFKGSAKITEEFSLKGVSPENIRKPFTNVKIPTDFTSVISTTRQPLMSRIPSNSRPSLIPSVKEPSKIISPARTSLMSPTKVSVKPSAKFIAKVSARPSVILSAERPISPFLSRVPGSKVPSTKIPSKVPSKISTPSTSPSIIPSGIPSPVYTPPPSTYLKSKPFLTSVLISSLKVYKPKDSINKLLAKKKKEEKPSFYLYGEKAAIATTMQILGRK